MLCWALLRAKTHCIALLCYALLSSVSLFFALCSAILCFALLRSFTHCFTPLCYALLCCAYSSTYTLLFSAMRCYVMSRTALLRSPTLCCAVLRSSSLYALLCWGLLRPVTHCVSLLCYALLCSATLFFALCSCRMAEVYRKWDARSGAGLEGSFSSSE